MPMLYVNTNLQDKDIPANFQLKLCEKIGEVLKKPMEKINLTMNTGVHQMRAGSEDPMVSLDIHSINVFDAERNPTYTPPLIDFLTDSLKLPKTRVVIMYHDLQLHNVGQVLS